MDKPDLLQDFIDEHCPNASRDSMVVTKILINKLYELKGEMGLL